MKTALFILTVCLLGPACLTMSTSTQAKRLRSLKEEVARRFQRRDGDDQNNIPELIEELGLTTLEELVEDADLTSVLSGPGPFTVFAPTNDAFDELPESFHEFIENPDNAKFILLFHVILANVPSSGLQNELLLDTALDNVKMRINLYDKDGDTVATAQCMRIDLTNVDNTASNGLIHVVDSVLIPPMVDLLGYICVRPDLSTLKTALSAASLLEGAGASTVFAPNDQAFMNLPPGLLETLLSDVTTLKKVLEYHVLDGTYCSAGLSSGQVTTLMNDDISINVDSDGRVMVNGANVIEADTTVTNGVVHVIDKVLIPPSLAEHLNP